MKIETERLILRNFRAKDCEELAPIMADPKGMKFSHTGDVLFMSETQDKISGFIDSYRKYGFGKWAVIYKEYSRLIGYCGIAVEKIDGKNEKEIGYRLDSGYWNQGLATEAGAAAIQYGFEKFRFPYILGVVDHENKTSIRVLDKLGMRYQRKTIFYGVEMDMYIKTIDEY